MPATRGTAAAASVPEPESEPEIEPTRTYASAVSAPTPAPSVDAAAIAAAVSAILPSVLGPLQESLRLLREDNTLLRTELKESRESKSAADEPEPEKFYVPDYGKANTHHSKPHTVTDEPQLYDLRGDRTHDAFEGKPDSSGKRSRGAHYFEFQTLACTCFYLLNVVLHLQSVLPRIITRVESTATVTAGGVEVSGADDADHLHAVYNTVKGLYDNLLNTRLQFLQLRCML